MSRQRAVEGGQTDGAVAQNFGKNTARTEDDDRTEHRVATAAENEFVGCAVKHGLHRDAGDDGAGIASGGLGHDLVVGFLDADGVFDTQNDAAGLGLVNDIRRYDLQHDRVSDLIGQADSLRRCPGQFDRVDRNAIGGKDGFGVQFPQGREAVGQHLVDEFPAPLAVDR